MKRPSKSLALNILFVMLVYCVHRGMKLFPSRGSEEVKSYSHLANIAAEESEGEEEVRRVRGRRVRRPVW